MVIRCLLFLGLLLLGIPFVAASNDPEVALILPANGNVSAYINNVTFICNATDDENVYMLSLYHSINGSFSLHGTNYVMGLENDSNTTLLCRFDNSYVCIDGEEGINTSTDFVSSKFMRGVMINESDTLKYAVSNNIEHDQGTIEFWIKVGYNPNWDDFVYLFSITGSSGDENKMSIYSLSGYLYFEFYDDSGGSAASSREDISSWNVGEWHHVAAAWDINNRLDPYYYKSDLFVDGSNYITAPWDDTFTSGAFESQYMYLGSDSAGQYQSNSTLDEFRISSWPRSAVEINASYLKGAGNHSQVSANWTINSISDGSYIWSCLAYDNESNSNWSLSNFTFHIDLHTPPVLNSVNFAPSSEDDIDPDMNISVTANVTDVSNVSIVIFQWKKMEDWNNYTMDFNNATQSYENATIEIDKIDNSIYYYRIWSNDSLGHNASSETQNLTAKYDYTWTATPLNFGTVSGFIESVKTIGNFTINNTGDDPLQFSITDDWPLDLPVFYNESENPSFPLPAKRTRLVIVNATFESETSERGITINVSASHSSKTPSPAFIIINGTLNSFIGGPYLNDTTEITAYPTSIAQGGSANFTAFVKNIGNETATQVWLNWTFPSGWSLAYGNLTNQIGNLSQQESFTLTVTASASSSAQAGAATVWLNSSCSEGSAGSDFKILSVTCNSGDSVCGAGCTYLSDNDCEAPSGSTAGITAYVGIGSGVVKEPEMSVSMPARVDLTKGQSYNISVKITNPVEKTNLTDLRLVVEGYPESLIKKTPNVIKLILPNESKSFLLQIEVPPYIEEKDYMVTVTLTGTGSYSGGTKPLKSTGKIVFAVHGVEENESLDAIRKAEEAIGKMEESDFAFLKLSDMLEDAKQAYDNLNFDKAKELSENILELKETAFRIFSTLGQVERYIAGAERYGISVEEAKKMQQLAKSAFQRGDYKRAEERITAAVTAYQLETKNILPLMKFLYDYWHMILFILFSVLTVSLFTRKKLKTRHLNRKLKTVTKRKTAIKDLIKKLEEAYFNQKTVSKLDYHLMKRAHEKRLAGLSAEENRLLTKMSLMKGRGRSESLLQQKKHAEDKMKGLQHDYFELGKIGKSEYNEGVRGLQAVLAEIEKELGKNKKTKRVKGFIGFFILSAFLFLSLNFAFAASLENATSEDAHIAINTAEKMIEDMKISGFGTERANHTLENAKLLFSRSDYELAVTTAGYVSVIKQKAVLVDHMIDEAELKIYELSSKGYDVGEAKVFFDEGVKEFENENYEDAEVLINRAMDVMDEMEMKSAISKAAEGNVFAILMPVIYENRLAVSLAVILIIIVSFLFSMKMKRAKKAKKIRNLEKETESIKNSMKALQEDYFNRGGVSKKNYDIKMGEYKKELSKAMETLTAEKGKKNQVN